jgi:hypothetical protein
VNPGIVGIPLYWTIWVALLLFCAGEFGRRRLREGSSAPWAWWAFVAGALLCAIHIGIAMKSAHAWSHEAAIAATARQTMAVYGVNWGGGVFVNYAFVAVWLFEAWRWRRPAEGKAGRVVTVMTRVFFLVMILNGAVIFAAGTRRIAGALLVVWLLWIWRPVGVAGLSRPGPTSPATS